MWRLGEQAEETFSSAWNNKMIVFSAQLIDHIPRWAICLLKGHPGPGKVERRESPGAVVTASPGQPGCGVGGGGCRAQMRELENVWCDIVKGDRKRWLFSEHQAQLCIVFLQDPKSQWAVPMVWEGHIGRNNLLDTAR